MSRLFGLVSWPNLTRLPQELAVPAARICGLLWHKRTAGALIPRVLDLPAGEVAVLLQVLLALGHVEAAGVPLPGGDAGGRREEPALPPPLPDQSLLGKFRRWLVTVH
ncbi:hypothetical protein [Caldimonas tepidiphila]|uniref:hypothetical protein n=1 Tax=Caldimonas tepidiphila TaxID=2315841 RepID=UPI000E5BE63E|nr:hypothetical protein [Caldimonas tepidiphila]